MESLVISIVLGGLYGDEGLLNRKAREDRSPTGVVA